MLERDPRAVPKAESVAVQSPAVTADPLVPFESAYLPLGELAILAQAKHAADVRAQLGSRCAEEILDGPPPAVLVSAVVRQLRLPGRHQRHRRIAVRPCGVHEWLPTLRRLPTFV